jgi:hypothetical protein
MRRLPLAFLLSLVAFVCHAQIGSGGISSPPGLPLSGGTLTGPLIFPAGTAASPGIVDNGATDTAKKGLYDGGTDILGFSTKGLAAYIVDAAQDMTIGATTQPNMAGLSNYRLSLVSNSNSALLLSLGSWVGASASTSNYVLAYQSRGATVGTLGALSSGDTIMRIEAYGDDGVTAGGKEAAHIMITAAAAATSGIVPGNISLTAANASGTQLALLNLSGVNGVTMSPAGVPVTISPTGAGTVTINPGAAGTINNVSLGGTTPAAVHFSGLYASTAATYIIDAAAVTISSGFGSTPSISSTSTAAFTVTIGSTPGTTGVLTMPGTVAHGWICQANDQTTNTETVGETANSTTSVTVTFYSRTTGVATAPTAADVVQFMCFGY